MPSGLFQSDGIGGRKRLLNLGPGSWTRVEFDRAIKKDRATTKDRWLNVKNESASLLFKIKKVALPISAAGL